MVSTQPILIAGAGIAGLAAAIGLARKGFGVTVLERQPVLTEAGAGIQIGPNGVKALGCLGVRATVEAVAFRPAGLTIRRGESGDRLTTLPWGEAANARYGAPFLTLLRTELQAALLAAAKATPGLDLVLGFEASAFAISSGGITVQADDGREISGAALVGADGLWSRVRAGIGPTEPQPAGYTAFRTAIPRAGLQAPFDAPEVGLWIGREAHVVHYPVKGGDLLNIVAVVGGTASSRNWDEHGSSAEIAPFVATWPECLRELLRRAPGWRRWTLHDLPVVPRWSGQSRVLIGDAAHPVLPFLAQGAVMALEDAVVLAAIVGAAGGLTPDALRRFESLRRPRALKLTAASRRNGRIYHLSGPAAAARDLALRLTPAPLLLRNYGWLYGFDPAAAANQ